MAWPNLGQWEWAIGEVIVLPLLFLELYRLRRSQRLDREKAELKADVLPVAPDVEGGGVKLSSAMPLPVARLDRTLPHF